MTDILNPLTPEEKAQKTQNHPEQKCYTPIVPVPSEGLTFDKATFAYHNQQFGKEPDYIHEYRLADGQLAMLNVRWDNVPQKNGKAKKEVRPYVYAVDKNGQAGWRSQSLDKPPLYNLHHLDKNKESGTRKILFVEGEKTAEAAQVLFPDYDVTTTLGGANASSKTDFTSLKGRSILISPDCGEAGARYGDTLYKRCRQAGAGCIQKFDTAALAKLIVRDGQVVERGSNPAKATYDLADALDEGWTANLMAAHRDTFIGVYLEKDSERIGAYKITPTGVYHQQQKDEEDWVWVCPYLKVTHQVCTAKGQSWGKLVSFYDPKWNLKTHIINNSLLAGDGREAREELASAGYSIPPRSYNRNQFNDYIHFSTPQKFATSIQKVGWHQEGVYVLPDKIYGKHDEDYVQHIKPHHRPQVHVKGDLLSWQKNMASYAQGNTRLILAIVTPLVAPFLTPLQRDGHIFNLYGNSSIGKSSALAVASSVTGFGMHSFLNTNNAFESVFVSHNDGCVTIDELGLARPDKVGEFVYVVINGKTKGRANQRGESIEGIAFKVNGLVCGEKTLGGKMGEAHHKTTAGQEVRFVDIPADAGHTYGIFEDTHGMAPQQLSDYLRRAAAQHRGTAFDALLINLTSQTWEDIANAVSPTMETFKAKYFSLLTSQGAGQAHRVLSYFALHAAVGEFCTQIKVLPWEAGIATAAYEALFSEWLRNQGNSGAPREVKETIEAINKLCQQQVSRFDVEGMNYAQAATSHNRAGAIKKVNGTSIFCVFPQVFREEIMGGKDEKVILPALVKMGVLKEGENGKRTVATRINKNENPVKMYHLIPSALEEQETGAQDPTPLYHDGASFQELVNSCRFIREQKASEEAQKKKKTIH